MKVVFTEIAMRQYMAWQNEDSKTIKKINNLIKDIQRNGFASGIGKPEPLKGNRHGCWSRCIDDFNRLVYIGDDNQNLEIISCKGHYDED